MHLIGFDNNLLSIGFSTELFNADVSFGYAAGISLGVTNDANRILTFGVGLGAGGGTDIDWQHQCFTRVSPTAHDLLSAATCSGEFSVPPSQHLSRSYL